jgi:hypothetical protein
MASIYALIRVPPAELPQVQHALSLQHGVGSLRALADNGAYNLLARLDVADSREEHRMMDTIRNTHGVSGAMILSRVPS